MKQQVPDEDFIRQYLLGELPEDARQRVEDRLFTDDEFYEAYLSAEDKVEDELIDQYVGGELSERERERFDRIFLSAPGRVEKLTLVRALHVRANPPAPDPQTHSPPPGLKDTNPPTGVGEAPARWHLPAFLTQPQGRFAALISVLLLAAVSCAGLLYLKSRRQENELAALRSQQQPQPTPDQALQQELSSLRAHNDELAVALRRAEEQRDLTEQRLSSLEARGRDGAGARPRPTPPSMPTLALSLIRTRGEGGEQAKEIKLTSGVTGVPLSLGLDTIDPSDYSSFRAVVSPSGGAPVWTRDGLRARAAGGEPHVSLTVPAGRLRAAGDYVVRLSGRSKGGELSLIGAYDFRVTR